MTPISILIGALGGQGGGVLAEWIVDAAVQAGYVAQGTSIPGVAQRTGATTYYVEVFPQAQAALGSRQPVLSLYPVPGSVDIVIASELLEAGRIVQSGVCSPERTLLIASTSRTLTTAEKMVQGDGRFATDRLLEAARTSSARLCAFDMDAAARNAGTVVSAVMLGAIAGSGVLPIARETFESAIRGSGVGVEASLRGFARGYAAVREVEKEAPADEAAAATATADEMIALGLARVTQFQDARYGALYRERLRAIDAAERAADPSGVHGSAVLRETARFLALWMAFDDVVNVARQKTRASRLARVRGELGAQHDDVVRIVDHFKPGVPELAGLLSPRLATRLVRWERARQARGREPLALALHLRTHTVAGYLLLRALGGLRPLRRLGARYADEQRRIEAWLERVARGCADDWSLGHEIALCGRLIKGYGATNERGKASLAHILEHLVDSPDAPQARAEAVRRAREAALADEGGLALDAELARHGAPPRPVVAQPIRWQPRARHGQSARAHS